MVRRYTGNTNGEAFLGNTNKKEVHDLDYEKVNCQIDEIIDAGYDKPFASIEEAFQEGYERCYWCMGNSKR
ncbi:MAG: hypothetical protein ACNS60_15940 [Candidatus Cyclobacteriaceae bacterium M2_1C_046]